MSANEADQLPNLTRKRFVDWFLGTGAGAFLAAILYPVASYWIPPETAEADVESVILPFDASELVPNSGRIFQFGSRPGIVVRALDGELRAFSARCTHLDCTVQYRDDLSHIWCACHNGHYDLNGRAISGPPPDPLETFEVRTRGEQIVVSLHT